MMSYGPALPPHLQRQREGSGGGEEEQEDRMGSGTHEDSEEDDSAYGPALPPHLRQGGKRESDEEEEEQEILLGPRPPPGYSREKKAESESESDDGEVIGPLPPKPGQDSGASSSSAAAADVERRSRKMLDKIEGRNAAQEPKRETWMLELPAEKAKNFGLGPRSFNRSSGAAESSGKKREARQAWAETPEMRAKRDRGETVDDGDDVGGGGGDADGSEDKDVLEYLASIKRDEEMEKVTNELREKRGTESLMEKHSKKISKKAKKEKDSGKTKERRPFDRDIDLQANRFDNAAKEAMLKRARQLDNRFSSGSSKYL